jgi:hypothetical protein
MNNIIIALTVEKVNNTYLFNKKDGRPAEQ